MFGDDPGRDYDVFRIAVSRDRLDNWEEIPGRTDGNNVPSGLGML